MCTSIYIMSGQLSEGMSVIKMANENCYKDLVCLNVLQKLKAVIHLKHLEYDLAFNCLKESSKGAETRDRAHCESVMGYLLLTETSDQFLKTLKYKDRSLILIDAKRYLQQALKSYEEIGLMFGKRFCGQHLIKIGKEIQQDVSQLEQKHEELLKAQSTGEQIAGTLIERNDGDEYTLLLDSEILAQEAKY